ncbi:diphosphomevalonate/mevalonate 3,5-bisphosphate decarboxylase family protein [Maribacter luteus]|uniref:Diphosphomevalonate decarboxylase n=1 Tax=Maribacter luteus TaxID=2594478 RepID=A0A6I2MKX7_9FLAO|nr:diphosphomevalonate decarboxylase [Maribacter luteus]MRX62764.1 diphosphomevalonate decarboxylase [Maribacter luteus]
MTYTEFLPSEYAKTVSEGKVTYRAPSNIALVKYWGKKEDQIPANPSISFTLDACATTTALTYSKLAEKGSGFSFELLFEGKDKPDFRPKIEAFFNRIESYLPFLKDYQLKIETSNSFPHSSGIASSASGMAALALCLMHIEKQLDPSINEEFFDQKASFLARLGSGSACRSIEGDLVQWGYHKGIPASSDLFAVKYPFPVHEVFHKYHDTILLVDKGQKQVSSTIGHNLMHGHPFAEQRFSQAHENITKLKEVFATGNLKGFIEVVESEALTLHAMMMTSMPYFILMKPNTLKIIQKIWQFRSTSKTHLCFTLDAGANVHVLYPQEEKEKAHQFIKDELVAYCENGQYICDRIGFGAKLLLP